MAGTSCRNNHVPHPFQSSAPFAQSAKQRRGHVSLSTTSFSARRPQGRKRRESEDVPERSPRHAPGFPVGVLDLVGLSTYRRPADQRWQQR